MIHNTRHAGYSLNYHGGIYTKHKRRQLGGSIFSAIFSGLKSLVAPLFGSFTKQAVKQTVVEGAKTLGKEALKSALPEAGKAIGQFASNKLNEAINSKPAQKLVEVIPQAEPILKKIPKVIDQKLIDSEVEKLRKRLAQMGDEDTGAGLKGKSKGKKKIMDYI